jgi:hypothetical protein
MSDQELEAYQNELLELRKKFTDRVAHLSDCKFYDPATALPPVDNIFATFVCHCRRHTPKCTGWYLLWNPNWPTNADKRRSSLHNHCATWQFKAVSKKIQAELVSKFGDHFELIDDDDTHSYSIETSYGLNYGFKHEEEEYPDFVVTSVGGAGEVHNEV